MRGRHVAALVLRRSAGSGGKKGYNVSGQLFRVGAVDSGGDRRICRVQRNSVVYVIAETFSRGAAIDALPVSLAWSGIRGADYQLRTRPVSMCTKFEAS